jgi:hypothetical protein
LALDVVVEAKAKEQAIQNVGIDCWSSNKKQLILE